jgi:predicted RNase H-like HicB family nuclease
VTLAEATVKAYTAVIERCADTGLYVGFVPGFPGAHTQAESLDELKVNLEEVISLLLEGGEPKLETEFVGTQLVTIAWPPCLGFPSSSRVSGPRNQKDPEEVYPRLEARTILNRRTLAIWRMVKRSSLLVPQLRPSVSSLPR